MKHLLLYISILGLLVLPAMSSLNCYYGWTSDEETDPDDWNEECVDENSQGEEEGEGCITVCEKDTAVCFKSRYEGGEGFFSVYGCVENPWDLDEGVHIPAHLSWEDLGLSQLPKPEDDEDCVDDESYIIPDGLEEHEPFVELGEEPSAVYCACSDGKCNGAEGRQSGLAFLSFLLLFFIFAF